MKTGLFNVNKYIQPCAFLEKDCAICINFSFYDLEQTNMEIKASSSFHCNSILKESSYEIA